LYKRGINKKVLILSLRKEVVKQVTNDHWVTVVCQLFNHAQSITVQ